jgi:hypothetical protein
MGDDARMISDDGFILAGFVAAPRWLPPEAPWTALLPPSVATVSDCLTDFVPADDDPLTAPWHLDLASAPAASRGTGTHALSMNLAAPETEMFLETFGGWGAADFHPLWRRLTHPVTAPTGVGLGFEVVGFESGQLHSWLCNSLQRDAQDNLGVIINQLGLLDTLDQARAVAAMANRDTSLEDVDWVAVRIIEHSDDRVGPDGRVS